MKLTIKNSDVTITSPFSSSSPKRKKKGKIHNNAFAIRRILSKGVVVIRVWHDPDNTSAGDQRDYRGRLAGTQWGRSYDQKPRVRVAFLHYRVWDSQEKSITSDVANWTILVATGKHVNRDPGGSGERSRVSQDDCQIVKFLEKNPREGDRPIAMTWIKSF